MTIASWLRRYGRPIAVVLLAIGGVAVLAALGAAARRRRQTRPVRAESALSRQFNRLLHQPSEDVDAAHLDAGDPPEPLAVPSPVAESAIPLGAERAVRPQLRLVGDGRDDRPQPDPGDLDDPAAALGAVVAEQAPTRAEPPVVAPSRVTPAEAPARRRAPLVVGSVLVLAVLAVAVAAALGGSDDGAEAGTDPATADDGETPDETTTPTSAPVGALAPDAVLPAVADGLEQAGSFRYQGTMGARDVSATRPGAWLAVNLEVAGEVDLAAARVHEVAVAADTREVVETTTDGATIWSRQAVSDTELAAVDYSPPEDVATPSGQPRLGVAQLPDWLRAMVGHTDAPRDAAGRRVVQAVLPAAVLGPTIQAESPVDATVLLSVDEAGNPVHLELTTGGDNPNLHLSLDITDVGAPVTVVPPTP